MPIRSRGLRSKTRYKLLKDPRDRGELPPNRILSSFDEGARVAIKLEPSQQKGMPHSRFHGLTGTVTGRQGDGFVVAIMAGNKAKTLVVRPEHLKAIY